MPPKSKIQKEMIIQAAFRLIHEDGMYALNARALAKKLNCSTQPIYSHYQNMDSLKMDVKSKIDAYYHDFMMTFIDQDHHLFTESLGYIEFARQEPQLFEALFLSHLTGKRTINEVLLSSWNQQTLEDTQKEFNIDLKHAQDLYRDVRFYTHGLASQICNGSIVVTEDEIVSLIRNVIHKLLKGGE